MPCPRASGVLLKVCHTVSAIGYIYVAYEKYGRVVWPHMTTHSLLNQTKVHTCTNQKALQSYRSSTGWESAALPGSNRILMAHPPGVDASDTD